MSNTMEQQNEIRAAVRQAYGDVAERRSGCCGPTSTCCGPEQSFDARQVSEGLGYEGETLDSVPGEANMGLGCGNPTAMASLRPGEVVLDLGSGGGLDALIAARAVGPTGRVIGVDMTPAMLRTARKNAVEMDVHEFVEFREGLIEELPVASASVDVVISNCVINLSPDKDRVFREAFRVLKPGGRLAVSDIVLSEDLPESVTSNLSALFGCVAGAALEDDVFGAMRSAGFTDIEFTRVPAASMFLGDQNDPMLVEMVESVGEEQLRRLASSIWSYKISARRP